ncbi:VOC family protein [Streptomyces halobius]|uniref:VOC family protein n=1 Tax=Streptomyces halobius TaxID=2879846 RepID=A0ABY4MBB1_9ACTN|nr:VOC family protein [Streptomyces halobius]UQA95076.1 VOC family protein [Streptomyces halobius]
MALVELGVTVLDCPDPRALADFYAGVLGRQAEGEDDWYEVTTPGGRALAFQQVDGEYRPPRWPGQEHPQQLHLDFDVRRADIDEAERKVLGLGAKLVQSDADGRDFRVYLDPAGHPFCLCLCDGRAPVAAGTGDG